MEERTVYRCLDCYRFVCPEVNPEIYKDENCPEAGDFREYTIEQRMEGIMKHVWELVGYAYQNETWKEFRRRLKINV